MINQRESEIHNVGGFMNLKRKVDNAIIMAAGTSSRFAPLSYEMPKALIEVKGEVLIERQIRQLLEARIEEIFVVTGYKAEQFDYLVEKFNVKLVHNPDYLIRNNNGSIWVVRNVLKNSYICSADNYFNVNPFERFVDDAYYAALYSDGPTVEWCIGEDAEGYINSVQIGGSNSWYMLGHAFWTEAFSEKFIEILENEYNLPETADKLWEKIYIDHLDDLKMRVRKYDDSSIYEFDTLDELRQFDCTYVKNTRSKIIREISESLGCEESDIMNIETIKLDTSEAAGFRFKFKGHYYKYIYKNGELEECC